MIEKILLISLGVEIIITVAIWLIKKAIIKKRRQRENAKIIANVLEENIRKAMKK